ncbi:M4 family metallopeptidase [Kaistella sp. G5-32]|uniref:M4 family metallopeptidase n=1 Tax=Kaistella gelatinilytica TaxID=2787636 RepID=A0ABS0F857_9FLAO|nr:M4 family metallopeptidase [Kaistella gelatinilytica]MBF8455887.1 M4 family metallopeptidase [Kaistella gelatinilytica]
MKKQLLTLGILGMLLSFTDSISAQDLVKQRITNANGGVSLVVFNDNSNLNESSVKTIFQDILKLRPTEELRLLKSEKDFTGKFTDAKYQLYQNNIKVEGGIYFMHYQNGKLISMNGEIFQDDKTSSTPVLSSNAAFQQAVKSVGAEKYMWEDAAYIAENTYKKPTGELVYMPVSQGADKYSLVLAYKFDIYAAQPLSRDYIFVDATEGRIIAVDPILKHAQKKQSNDENLPISVAPFAETSKNFPTLVLGTADTRYSGTQNIQTTMVSAVKYTLNDTTRGGGVRTYNLKKSTTLSAAVDFEDNDNNWTAAEFDNATFDNAALDAHLGVENTYDYFFTTFGRNSYDGSGTLLRSYVHYGNAYENAGWTGSEMIYGDGASTFKPLTAYDVTAHELGHGVCSSSAALIYNRESGAMNEGLSDIWAAAAEFKYAPTKQTWLIGEDITKVSPFYLRSMSNPKSGLSPQPDTYHGINWKPATIEEGCAAPNSNTNDNCGVHYNSGVLNHWFYILSVGKAGTNDIGSIYNVTGITIAKAEKIVYRLETTYLTPSSNYRNARDFGIQAAKDLYGVGSPEAIATQDAFYAVGIGPKYLAIPDTTAPTAPTSLAASNTTGVQTKLTWNASTDTNGIDRYVIYKDGTETATVAGNVTTSIVTGLSTNTTYSFYIKAVDPYDNVSAASNTVSVTTLNTPAYCVASSSSTTDERIKRVQIGTIDNPSTSLAGYEDFSYLTTDVTKESSYPITITPEWTSTVYSEAYAVFVDWNNDGDFLDAGETAFTKAASTVTPVVGNITVPPTYTYTGPVRMRVIMRFSTTPTTACGTIPYGQIEDYTLNVKDKILAASNVNNTTTAIYPNPVKDVINIQSKVSGEFSYKIFNTAGQIVNNGTSADKKVNVQKLTVGTYIIELTDKTGSKITNKFIKK